MPAKIIDTEMHITDIQRYKSCRRAWDWGSHLRRNLEPKERYQPFWLGTLVHYGLEMWYRSQMSPAAATAQCMHEQLTDAQKSDPRNQESANLATGLVNNYIAWQRTDRTWLADSNFEFIAPEFEGRVSLWQTTRMRVWLAFRFDGIVKRRDNGLLYLWEIKTTRSISEREKQLDFDEQTGAYLWAARQLGYDVQGAIYTLIRKKLPESPAVLKNGFLSVNKSIDTTASHYLDCVRSHHAIEAPPMDESKRQFILREYGDVLTHLGSQPNKFFRRLVVNRTAREIEHFAGELIDVAREMISARTPIYPTATDRCNYCLFRSPCLARNRGQDYEKILENEYQRNERR